jgi:hypothetical protein
LDANVTELGTKVLFLLIPGIIGFNVVAAYGPKRNRSDLEIGLQIFVYGVVAYLVAGFIFSIYTILEEFPWQSPQKSILLIPEIFKLTTQNSLVNRPGISGGSNSEVDWSHDEQDNEQI